MTLSSSNVRHVLIVALAALLPSTARAMTFIAPVDYAELALGSDVVTLAMAGENEVVERGDLLYTRTFFDVIDWVHGDVNARRKVLVEVPGGEKDGKIWRFPGMPNFKAGSVYLLPLDRKTRRAATQGAEVYVPTMFSYGLLEEAIGTDGSAILVPIVAMDEMKLVDSLPRPDGQKIEPIGVYDRDDLLRHLAEIFFSDVEWSGSALEVEPSIVPPRGDGAGVPGGCSYFSSGGRFFRWRAFDNGGSATIYADETGDLSLSGGGFREVVNATNLWMDIPGSGFNLVFGGKVPLTIGCSGGQDSQNNTIVFNDPCNDIGNLQGCGGVLAFGGPGGSGTHNFDNDEWITVSSWIVVCNNGVGCLGSTNWTRMIAHELGHGLGFGHVNDGNALMFANCCNNINSTDRLCGQFTYPSSDPQNQRPSVDAGSSGSRTLARNSVRLEGEISDDGRPAGRSLVATWRQLGGPGTVTFADANSATTTATFSQSGTYILGLTGNDGRLISTDSVELDVQTWVGSLAQLSFRQRSSGYSGTVDTFLQEDEPDADNRGARELGVDDDDPSGSDRSSQILLRFDDIFGAAARQIPPGASIQGAQLILTSTNLGDGATLHRMNENWDENVNWNSFGGDGIQAGDESRSASDAQVVGAADSITIDVTSSLRAWSGDPCSNHGWAFLPVGGDGWDFYSAEGTTPPQLVVQYLSTVDSRLVELGDVWSFLPGLQSPPAAWNQPGFDDAGWRDGATGIGYGDGDDETVLGNMRGNYLTVYSRREFFLDEITGLGRLRLRIDYDDGFVAYLNGEEVARSSSMGAAASPVNRATESRSREAGNFEEYSLPSELLIPGSNLLAIEVHNSGVDSSDLSFRPELLASNILLDEGQEWSFRRGNETIDAGWNDIGFDDANWETGAVGIGYGDGDDLTVLEDMRGSYASVFCRRSFELASPDELGDLQLSVIYDDGIVVYLNGREIGREGMPGGAVGRGTLASSSNESEIATFRIGSDDFRSGENVLAVSVHNISLGSSDLSFVPLLLPLSLDATEVDCDGPPPPTSLFQRGDATADGRLDLSDAVFILNYLFLGGEKPECLDAADSDDGGSIALTDAILVLNFLFQGDDGPRAPGLICGEDPTKDSLEDCTTAVCESA